MVRQIHPFSERRCVSSVFNSAFGLSVLSRLEQVTLTVQEQLLEHELVASGISSFDSVSSSLLSHLPSLGTSLGAQVSDLDLFDLRDSDVLCGLAIAHLSYARAFLICSRRCFTQLAIHPSAHTQTSVDTRFNPPTHTRPLFNTTFVAMDSSLKVSAI